MKGNKSVRNGSPQSPRTTYLATMSSVTVDSYLAIRTICELTATKEPLSTENLRKLPCRCFAHLSRLQPVEVLSSKTPTTRPEWPSPLAAFCLSIETPALASSVAKLSPTPSELKSITLEKHYDSQAVRSYQRVDGVYDLLINALGSSPQPTLHNISIRGTEYGRERS